MKFNGHIENAQWWLSMCAHIDTLKTKEYIVIDKYVQIYLIWTANIEWCRGRVVIVFYILVSELLFFKIFANI